MSETVLAYIDAINRKDLDAAMELFSPDAELINSKYRPTDAVEGLELIQAYIKETVIQQNGHISLQELSEKEGVIEAKIALQSDRIKQVGLSRILGTEKFWLKDGKIKGFTFDMNLADEETKRFFDFVRALEASRPIR